MSRMLLAAVALSLVLSRQVEGDEFVCNRPEGSTCGAGCFLDTANQVCESAPAGFYSPVDDNDLYECRVGHFSIGSAEACTPCPPGRYMDTKGSDTCFVCGIATYSPSPGSKKCLSCNPALYVGYGSDDVEVYNDLVFCLAPPVVKLPTVFSSSPPSIAPTSVSVSPSNSASSSPSITSSTLAPTQATSAPTPLMTTLSPSKHPVEVTKSEEPSMLPSALAPTWTPSTEQPTRSTEVPGQPSSMEPSGSSQAPTTNTTTTEQPTTTHEPSVLGSDSPSLSPWSSPSFAPTDDPGLFMLQNLLWMVALPLFLLSLLICCSVCLLMYCSILKRKKESPPDPEIFEHADEVSDMEDEDVYLDESDHPIDGMSVIDVDDGGSTEVFLEEH